MNRLYKRFSEINSLVTFKKSNLKKNLFVMCFLVGLLTTSNEANAQQALYDNVTVELTRVDWRNLDCADGVDVFILGCVTAGGGPDPRFRYQVAGGTTKYLGNGVGPNNGILLDNQPETGGRSINSPTYFQRFDNTCRDNMSIFMQAWEEDQAVAGVGLCGEDVDYTYNDGLSAGCVATLDGGGLSDDFEASTTDNFDLPYGGNLNDVSGSSSQAFTFGAWTMTYSFSWNKLNAPTISPAAPVACVGTTVTLTSSNPIFNANNIEWFTDQNDPSGSSLGFGTSVNVIVPSLPFTVYAAEENNNCYGAYREVTITQAPAPNQPTANGAQTCVGGAVTLSAASTSPGADFIWYDADPNTTGIVVGTGPNFTTPAINLPSEDWWVIASFGIGCESPATQVTVTTDLPLVAPNASSETICDGYQIGITATSGGPNTGFFNWYSDASLNSLIFVGNPFITPNLNADATYYVTENFDDCETPATTVNVTVIQGPGTPSPDQDTLFTSLGGTVTYTVSAPLGMNEVYRWYADNPQLGGPILFEGNTWTSPPINVPIEDFFVVITDTTVDCDNGNLKTDGNALRAINSEAARVVAIAMDLIAPPLTENDTICQGEMAELMATADSTGAVIVWFSSGSPVDSIATGDVYITPALTQNTTYYVGEYIGGLLVSELAAVTAVVNPKPTPLNITTDILVCAGDDLTVNTLDEQIGDFMHWIVIEDVSGDTIIDSLNLITSLSQEIDTMTASVGEFTFVTSIVDAVTGCESDVSLTNVSILAPPAAPNVAGNVTFCSGESTILTATATAAAGGSITWYSDAALTNVIGNGAQFITPNLTGDTTIYVTESNEATDPACESPATQVDITVITPPEAPEATDDSICAGETAILEAVPGTNQIILWFSDGSGNNSLGMGNTYTTQALTQTTTFFAIAYDTISQCLSEFVPVLAVVRPTPDAPQAADVTVCTTEDAILTATGSGTGDLVFYNDAFMEIGREGMPPATGSLNLNTLAAGVYLYYVTEDDGNCESDLTEIEVTVGDAPIAGPNVTGDLEICSGETATLTAVGTGGSITWYSDTTGAGTVVSVGAQFTTPVLTMSTTYYVSESFGSCEGPIEAVEVVVNSLPSAPIVTGDSVCVGEMATLSALGNMGTMNWYEDASAAVVVFTGDTFVTPDLTQTTTFYVQETSTDGCLGPITPVQAYVRPMPTPASLAPQVAFCEGDDVIVTATVDGSNIGATLNSVLIDVVNDTTNSLANVIVTTTTEVNFGMLAPGTYTHYATVNDGNCNSATVTQTIIVNESPDAPTVVDTVEICSGETATLFAFGEVANPNSIITWFDNMNFDPIAVGWEYETQPLIATQTFFANVTDENGCISELSSVTVVVNDLPVDPVGTNDSVCFGSPATLTVMGAEGLYTWYSDGAGSNAVATGNTFTTPALSQNTTYYVSETNTLTGCTNENLVAVTGVIIPGPDAPTPQVGDITICVNETGVITANGSGNGVLIWYDADLVQLEIDSMPPATGEYTVNPFATAGTYFFYVTESNGECESPFAEIEVVVTEVPDAPVGTGDTICYGESTTISAIGTGGVINWYADAGLTMPVSSGAQYETGPLSGNTSYWATESYGSCEGPAIEVEVVVNPLPETPTVGSNAPICEGETLMLTASTVFGTTISYAWTGPNGFTSTEQNPIITNVSEADHQGVYTVVVTDNATGCQSGGDASVMVDILPTPEAPSLTSNSPICEGEDLVLTASEVDSATYTFYDASNGVLQTGSSNTLTIPMITLAQAGVYGVSATVDGCESAITTTVVVVKPRPAAVAVSNNGPVCENGELNVIAEVVSGASYTWIGPDGNPVAQNGPIITISPVQLADAGTYSVFITIDGCSSDTSSTDVEVIEAPVLTQEPTTNSPVCEHDTMLLQAPYDPNLTYEWIGPDGYTPDITYIDTVNNFYTEAVLDANENDHQGFYTLVVTDNTTGCSSQSYVVLVTVNKFPDNIIADNNGPACEGDDVQLSVTSIVNASYTWTGPNNYVSFEQNPVLENVDPDIDAGVYEVTIILGGCVSMTATTEVVIYRNPIADAGADFSVEEGTIFQLDGNGSVEAIDFAWIGEDQSWFTDPTSPNPWIGTDNPLPARDEPYVFVLTVYNQFGCTDQDTVLVTVFETLDVEIPNIITPNGDGVNDTWVITYLDNLDNYELAVYARGGTLIFRTSDYSNNWNGEKDGTELPEGTYWYTIHSDNQSIFKGYIEIVR